MPYEDTAWRTERRKYLGGTDIAAIAGLNPYASPMDVYCQKKGLIDDKFDNNAMARGRYLEPAILNWFYDTTGFCSAKPAKALVKHPNFDFLGGNPDDIAKLKGGKLAVVEVKTVGPHAAHSWGEPPDGNVPPYYWAQTTWYAGLLQIPEWFLVADIGGRDGLQIYRGETDFATFEDFVEMGIAFWDQYIATDTAPPVDGSNACKELLAKLHPEDTGEIIQASEDLMDEIAELYKIKQESNALYKRQLEIENLIKANMQDASFMSARGWEKPFSWKRRKDSVKIDYQQVAVRLAVQFNVDDGQFMAIVNQHAKTVPGPRVFIAPWTREKKED